MLTGGETSGMARRVTIHVVRPIDVTHGMIKPHFSHGSTSIFCGSGETSICLGIHVMTSSRSLLRNIKVRYGFMRSLSGPFENRCAILLSSELNGTHIETLIHPTAIEFLRAVRIGRPAVIKGTISKMPESSCYSVSAEPA